MEIDRAPKSSEATHSHRTPTEENLKIITKQKNSSVEPLSKKETIATLVKAHVALRDRFEHAQRMNNIQSMKVLFFRAQESQKALQKLITNRKIETYIQG